VDPAPYPLRRGELAGAGREGAKGGGAKGASGGFETKAPGGERWVVSFRNQHVWHDTN
jgi:hypothetical protein